MRTLFDLVEQFKDINDSRDILKINVEARAGAGAISRLFGPKAGDVQRELPGGPIQMAAFDSIAEEILDSYEP